MDARMDREKIDSAGLPVWDLYVDITLQSVPIIAGSEEADQQAAIAAYVFLGGIPQLPARGVDWLGFLGGAQDFGGLDAGIRDALARSGHADYMPEYDVVNDMLTVAPRKVGL